MILKLFLQLLLVTIIFSLLSFALIDNAGFSFLVKNIAFGTGVSLLISFLYPYLRGVQKGDVVAISGDLPFFGSRIGTAISGARKNAKLRVRFEDGQEAFAILESYAGVLSPPKVRILYEERLV